MAVRTRFAPSPTGYLHIGGVRTALYSWLYARHHGGTYLLRIEDTDRERSTQAAVDAIIDGLDWLGLHADDEPIFQSQRFDRYAQVLAQLLQEGKAYRCYCTREELDAMRKSALAQGVKPRYDGRCRNGVPERPGVAPVIRFKNPQTGEVVIDDLVKGQIVVANHELDDLIIARSDGTPTYNFCVVVDDIDMRITHVIRGDDHVNNTPRQMNLIAALGHTPPAYAHLPMLNGPDGTKLSKRHGAVSVLEYRDMGFLPEALLNYLLRLGWSHGDQEIFTRDEMVRLFDLSAVHRSSANFDPAKLLWVNQQHILRAPRERLVEVLAAEFHKRGWTTAEGPPLEAVVDALRERSSTIVQMADQARVYFMEPERFAPDAVAAHLHEASRPVLAELRSALAAVPEWTEASTQQAVEQVAARLQLKLGKVAQPLRVALTGQAASPGIGTTLALVGRERALQRLDAALQRVDASADEAMKVDRSS